MTVTKHLKCFKHNRVDRLLERQIIRVSVEHWSDQWAALHYFSRHGAQVGGTGSLETEGRYLRDSEDWLQGRTP